MFQWRISMGLFDQVVGALAGGEAGSQGGLLQTVMQLVNDPKSAAWKA
jgi:hypothetical protein